ncbi:MAG: prolipoprotein diacylglyceryl transferase [Gammaproteobacteria bacterium]
MIIYPEINPNALTIGSFSIKWYGVCYLIAFLWCYWQAILKKSIDWSKEQIENLLFYIAVGVILGGRIGYVLFYFPSDVIHDPLGLLQFWLPGRSFHGGLLGVLITIVFYAKKYHSSFLTITDFIAPIVPIGIMCGRVGNFINGELWGRVTNVPWAMVFRHVDQHPRHPSQIYELLLEGVLLFFILKMCDNKKQVGYKSAVFLIFYAVFRIFVENYREPDFEQGYILAKMTMGQILSIPMLVIGIILYLKAVYSKNICNNI